MSSEFKIIIVERDLIFTVHVSNSNNVFGWKKKEKEKIKEYGKSNKKL